MRVFAGCVTDKGNYREKNQDRAVCRIKKWKKEVFAVACVCDGIGSYARSEIASEMMTDGINRWFDGIKGYFPTRMSEEALAEDLELTIRELNELVCSYRLEQGIEIGCTMSVMLLVNRNYHVFHAGDSRIYCVRDRFYQITRDEVSMVESQGKIKSRLANYIGRSKELWMNKCSGSVAERDLFLLGSDGLFKQLEYENVRALADRIKNDRKAQKVSKKLIEIVMQKGERDNVSCILMYIASL